MAPSPKGSRSAEHREELVHAVCHEVRNLLAATQLIAHALDPELPGAEIASSARRIAGASARAGSLLAQLRPLLAGSREGGRCRPADALADLARACEGVAEPPVELDVASAASLPDACIDPETLHHLLLSAVLVEGGDSGEGEAARVSLSGGDGFVCFRVEGAAGDEGPASGLVLCGRALARSLARVLLEERGGRLDLPPGHGGARAELCVPLASD